MWSEPRPWKWAGHCGQTIDFYLNKIERVEDLQSALDISVEAEGSYMLFSASARFSFVERCHFNSYSLFLLARTTVKNSFLRMRDVKINPSGTDLLRNGQVDRFREEFGDVFVLGLQTGGEFFSVLEIKTRDATEQKNINASLNAQGGLFATFSVHSDFSQAILQATSDKTLKITCFQQGGNQTQMPMTVEEVVNRAANFASMVAGDKGVPYSVLLQDYRAIDWPDGLTPIDLQNQRESLQEIARQRNSHVTLLEDVDFVLANQEQFVGLDAAKVNELNAARNKLTGNINNMTRLASRCANHITECTFPTFDIPLLDLPKRRIDRTGRHQPLRRGPQRPLGFGPTARRRAKCATLRHSALERFAG